jgi:uncharacterized membrane protein SpoIIM required for sporulation
LYRQAAADLSTARDDTTSASLAGHLNQLLGRAHNLIYAGRRVPPQGMLHFFGRTFPRVFRQTLPYTAAAVALFLAGAALGILLTGFGDGFERYLLGGEMMDTIDRREMWTHRILAVKPLASGQIMTNNLAVALAACATGMLAGIGTTYMMVFNGVLIGVIGAACHRAGLSTPLWSFVAPHGALELPAIFIAGGAGLVLARAIVAPGLLPRREAVSRAGGTAIRLFLGVIPLLVIAGVIEGFISPTPIDPAAKLVTGAGIFALLVVYLARGGTSVTPGSGPSR